MAYFTGNRKIKCLDQSINNLKQAISENRVYSDYLFIEATYWGYGTAQDHFKSYFWWKFHCNEFPRDYSICDPANKGFKWKITEKDGDKIQSNLRELYYLIETGDLNLFSNIEVIIP